MMARFSALFVLVSQGILIALILDTSGQTAILFSFLGHPAMAAGVLFGIWALARQGSAAKPDDETDPP